MSLTLLGAIDGFCTTLISTASPARSWQILDDQTSVKDTENIEQALEAQATELLQLGKSYDAQERLDLALELYQKALAIYEQIGDAPNGGLLLYRIGTVYQRQGNYEQSLASYQEALEIATNTANLDRQWRILTTIGTVYGELGLYTQGIEAQERSLEIAQRFNRPMYEQTVLSNLGLIYRRLGDFDRALSFYQRALFLNRQAKPNSTEEQEFLLLGEGILLHNIGSVYEQQGGYLQAIDYYEQSLEVKRQAGNKASEAETLNNLGVIYSRIEQPERALPLLEQSIRLAQESGDRDVSAYATDSLGSVYRKLGQTSQAWLAYQSALSILIEIGDRSEQSNVLSNIGELLVQQNQPELAIVFYKRSVNITEEIRRGIQGLPIEQQQSYTNTIADTYRKLAALLIQQDRILEAQQVLDLLKVQEIQDYLRRGVRSSEQTSQGVYLWEAEQRVFASFETLLQDGQRLAELQAIAPEELTAEQRTELLELHQKSQQIQATFNRFVDLPDVQAALQRLRLNARQAFGLENLNQLRSNLSQLRSDAVLLYPLVLDDRLELVILSPNLDPLHKTVDVTRVELNQTISDFLRDLQDPESDPKSNAAKLYDWLIRPIEGFLRESGAKVVLYAPDRQLRYIPLAALYDGQQWFVENYQINHITAVSLTNLNIPPRPNPRILAGAYSEGRHLIARRGESPLPFRGLPFAKVEVQTIASLFPGTRQLINQDFTEASTLPFLNSYNIVHFATHAIFTTGSSEDSYIVMGNGDTIDLNEIRTLSLGNVDLMVLSGCQTAVNNVNLGQELGEGTEILGFGYQVQNAGARATIASLWSVDDGGTEVLMSQFYALLQQANRSKTETLQQAQIALIREQENFQLQDALIRERNVGDLPRISAQELTHPYYWAPFILIGNGL